MSKCAPAAPPTTPCPPLSPRLSPCEVRRGDSGPCDRPPERAIQRLRRSAPERIRTSDLRFRRPTAKASRMALGSRISGPQLAKTRQKLDRRRPGHARSLAERSRDFGLDSDDRVSSLASVRCARAETPAHVHGSSEQGRPPRGGATAQIRPSQQRANARTGVPPPASEVPANQVAPAVLGDPDRWSCPGARARRGASTWKNPGRRRRPASCGRRWSSRVLAHQPLHPLAVDRPPSSRRGERGDHPGRRRSGSRARSRGPPRRRRSAGRRWPVGGRASGGGRSPGG